MRKLIQEITTEFENRFNDEYMLVKSPGRVNLIGEHTDYNEGFVLPAAVDKSIILAISPNELNQFRFYSVDKKEKVEVELSAELGKSSKGWPNYLLGVVDQLKKHGYEPGAFDCVFGGNIPIGAGMSSSAALEGGVLYGLVQIHGWKIPPLEMAKIAQQAENEFVGVQCGIMDQFASLNGKEGHAIRLDCRSLEYEYIPFGESGIRIVLCDTGVRRELASSEYNVRRSQCEQGVALLQSHNPQIQSLRDVSLDFLNKYRPEMDPIVYKRCKYVIEENQRVLDACNDLQDGNLGTFGRRMYESHRGLQNEYEVSCRELDILVEIAENIEGVLGARMMGGGFGGCTINLVQKEAVEHFVATIRTTYQQAMDHMPKVYETKISKGTHLLSQAKLSSKS